jgi:3-hydroxyisobutyrate dehydrogenase-like beta-hydroxyacid dehydrogenase
MPRAKKDTVGIVGLGIMGGAFAQNLLAAGWRVIGYDVAPARRRAVAKLGADIAENTEDVVRQAQIVITSLPKPSALVETAAGIAKAGMPRRIIVEMSTFALEDKARAEAVLRKAGHVMLDCPVSGTGAQALIKDLVVYASGDSREIRKLRGLFSSFTRAAHDVGTFGNGSRMKYVANLLVAIHNVASAEAMVLGMKAGLPPKLIFNLIKTGAGNSRIFELRAPMMVKNSYRNPTMKISVWQKDMDVIGSYARKIAVPTPMFDASKRSAAVTRPKILRQFAPCWKKWRASNGQNGALRRREWRPADTNEAAVRRSVVNVIARWRSPHGGGGRRPQQS